MIKLISVLCLALFLLVGCSTTQKEWGTARTKENGSALFYETGFASRYGERHVGKKTAFGERYDPKLLTGASRTLPFNSLVMVKDPKTNRFVIVRINDRGPFTKKRVIDLSDTAARKLGIYDRGIARVNIYVMSPTTPK